MKRLLPGMALLALLLVVPACDLTSQLASVDHPAPMEIYFSPGGGCTDAVVREIRAAQQNILVQAYSFTSAPIAEALVQAHQRGVHVQVVLDSSQRSEKYSAADFLLNSGLPTLIDAKHAIAHNKIMILDGRVVLTGSFNFTKQAEEHNAENLLVIRDPEVAARYTANWQAHADHAESYGGRSTASGNSNSGRSTSHRSHTSVR